MVEQVIPNKNILGLMLDNTRDLLTSCIYQHFKHTYRTVFQFFFCGHT